MKALCTSPGRTPRNWGGPTLVVALAACSPTDDTEPLSRVSQGAAQLPVVGPEVAMDVPVGVPISVLPSPTVTVSFDGTRYLAAWNEGGRIVGGRVDLAGSRLDVPQFAISSPGVDAQNPASASNGSLHLIVWDDSRNGSRDVFAARVASTGQVLDPAGIAVSTGAGNQSSPSVVWDGGTFFVVWQDDSSGTADIQAARVAPGGLVSDFTAVATGAGAQMRPDVAWTGGHHLVVWEDTRNGGLDVFAARVGSSGPVLDPAGIAVVTHSASQTTPKVASRGGESLVVWRDPRNSPFVHTFGARIDAAGQVLDGNGNGVPIVAEGADTPPLDLTWNGVNYALLHNEDPCADTICIRGTLLQPDGSDAGLFYGNLLGRGRSAAMAWGGSSSAFLIVHREEHFENGFPIGPVVGNQRGPNGNGGGPLSLRLNRETFPVVASNSSAYLALWLDDRRPGPTNPLANFNDVFGVRLDAQGSVLDAPAIPIEFVSQWPLPSNLTASSAGSTYLLAFDYTFELRAAVYAVNSAGMASGPTHEASDTRAPALASDGSAHLLAYIASGQVHAKRFDVAGQPIDSSPLVLSSTSSNKDGTVAGWCGASYLVVWQDDRNGALDLFSSRAGADGTVLGADQPLVTASADQKNAALVWNGQSCLLVWHDERSGSAELWAARVSSTGSLIGSAFLVSSGLTGEARVAWDGAHHVVVWGDGKAARVAADGSVVDTTPFSIASGIANPVIASVGGRRSLVTYERSERVYARVIDDTCMMDGGGSDGAAGSDASGGAGGADASPDADAGTPDAAGAGGAAGDAGAAGAGGMAGGDAGASGSGGAGGADASPDAEAGTPDAAGSGGTAGDAGAAGAAGGLGTAGSAGQAGSGGTGAAAGRGGRGGTGGRPDAGKGGSSNDPGNGRCDFRSAGGSGSLANPLFLVLAALAVRWRRSNRRSAIVARG